MIGTTLGHYRITEKVGAGGMGEVYRAEDSNLHRHVAIKVLPGEFVHDAERLARFQREAEVLASLNHPNIAAIYGLEESGGKRFIVMELVEGQTLAQRLLKGPLPVAEALETCRQIAEGLEAAHEKGVIHRDLKPANVMITAEDKVKILDFGLAKALVAESAAAVATQSPTITEAMTRPGTILGSAAYMSPEQAKGKPVDKRADIWAFGCILYECLTGKAPFKGETVTETLAKILEGTPDWNLLPAATPRRAKDLLHRCLQRNPKERLHDIADVRIEIGECAAPVTAATSGPQRPSMRWAAVCAGVTLLAGVLIGRTLAWYFDRRPARLFLLTAAIKVEAGHSLDGMRRPDEMQRPSRTSIAISGDGRFIIYSAVEENAGPEAKPQLYLRRMDQSQARPIAGTAGAINPFLAPDDRWVGFWADGKLNKTPVEGGVATPLCDAAGIFGANWGRDDRIVFSDRAQTGLLIVSAEGGRPETLTKPDQEREESSHRLPSWLPDGKGVLFTVMRHSWDSHPSVALLRPNRGQWHELLQDATDAKYVPTGHVVFLRQGTLMAARFDLSRMEIIGQPVAIVENVMQASSPLAGFHTCAGQFGISDTGSLIYAAGGLLPEANDSFVWVDQTGTENFAALLPLPLFAPRLAPDGRRIAYVSRGREWRVWVYDLDRGTNTPLTREGRAIRPIWSPDSKQILFGWHRSLVPNLFLQAYDGSSDKVRLTSSEYSQYPGSWSPDGQLVACVESHPDTGYDVTVLNVRSGLSTVLLNSASDEAFPEFSPDGRWIAYASRESSAKRAEVYVQPFPGPGTKHPVSSEGGVEPLWARDGRQLFYRWQDQVWVADVQTYNGFATSKPRLLFERPGYLSGSYPIRGYDLSLDGKRFLMVKYPQRKPQPITELILVQNWFEEIKRLAPASK